MDNPTKSSVILDVLSAAGANLVALVVGYPLAIVAPTFLVIILPFGMFWVYVLLVGLYALAQFRKGRKRRALLAGSLAAVVLIVLGTSLRIA
jgi:membrane-bound metal-dependent hydrolase YbcI (DUF457 family)